MKQNIDYDLNSLILNLLHESEITDRITSVKWQGIVAEIIVDEEKTELIARLGKCNYIIPSVKQYLQTAVNK